MNAQEYIAFLEERLYAGVLAESQVASAKRWGQIRTDQTGNPKFAEYSIKQASNPHARTEGMNNLVFKPFRKALSRIAPSSIRNIPIGLLPIRIVNAHTLKAPNGEPFIIMDGGLPTMIHFYIETLLSNALVAERHGTQAAVDHLFQAYRFIVQYFSQSGKMSFPEDVLSVPQELLTLITAMSVAVETFVVAHEMAHVHAGHLANATTKSFNAISEKGLSMEFYQLSWKQEFEADDLGWRWYQATWKSISLLNILRSIDDIEPRTAPLMLFPIIALIEKNLSVADQFSTHPPAHERVKTLIDSFRKEGDERVREKAVEILELVEDMPNSTQLDVAAPGRWVSSQSPGG
jgi:hypothetical protein